MCKIVYLTTRRFNSAARHFRSSLASELRGRGVEVKEDSAFDLFNFFRRHRTYGIAIALDFYRDGGAGSGLTLNKNCNHITRDFAYTLSNAIDNITPEIIWRDFNFVLSDDKQWYRFFNKVSATTKAIFYLCTRNNSFDWEVYTAQQDKMVKIFADEIIRCLRSDYDSENYRKRVLAAKLKVRKKEEHDNGMVER